MQGSDATTNWDDQTKHVYINTYHIHMHTTILYVWPKVYDLFNYKYMYL